MEIEGSVEAEIDSFDKDTYIKCDDGTIVRMSYIKGVWKAFIAKGEAECTVKRLQDRAGDDYTDEVTIETDGVKKWWQK